MDENFREALLPSNLDELWTMWNRFPEARPVGGSSNIVSNYGYGDSLSYPDSIISLASIQELQGITRSERYIDIGAMTNLNQILALGKAIPEILLLSLNNIASPQLRNIATIGGNINSTNPKGILPGTIAALSSLDALLEFHSPKTSRWISVSRFAASDFRLDATKLLSKVRIPIAQWNYASYKRFDLSYYPEIIVMTGIITKTSIAKIKIVYSGTELLQSKAAESIIEGKNLPLETRTIKHFIDEWKENFENANFIRPLIKSQILSFLETELNKLT
ncbi:MAG: FAD binding domain-containing protein [Spirochaetaceae bacterium]|nr:FAD binding domain-containing protein [Spirochaetaceae bacterium]